MGGTCSGSCLTIRVLRVRGWVGFTFFGVSVGNVHEDPEEARRVGGAQRRGTAPESRARGLDGATVVAVARRYVVGRQTVHEWLRPMRTVG